MQALVPGQMLGPYRIVEQIGQGGMAVVYKAYHAAMDRYVAIKILPYQLANSPDLVNRFKQEARTIANLEHKHILPVYDYGESEGLMYLVMRYLAAGTLKDRLQAGALGLAEIDRLFTDLAGALGYAHTRNIVHRDLKPANVLLDEHGDIFLTDFGVAKLLESTEALTQTGGVLGTPAYMSPEQAQGRAIDQRSDIYALGIILYEMLLGRRPFDADTPLAVLLMQASAPLPLPSVVKPDLLPALEQVLLKALAKNPADRFASVADFLAAWKQALGSPATVVAARPAPPRQSSVRLALPCLVLVLGGGLVLAVLALGFGLWQLYPQWAAAFQPTPTRVTPATARPTTPTPEPSAVPDTPSPEDTATPTEPAVPAIVLANLVNVSHNARDSNQPQLALDAHGGVHLSWFDMSLRAYGDYLYSHRKDQQWSPPENWTADTSYPSRFSPFRWTQRPDGSLCGIWNAIQFYIRCQRADANWDPSTRLSTSRQWSEHAIFTYSPQGELHNLYLDSSMALRYGSTQLSDGYGLVDEKDFVFDQAGGVHVVWMESPYTENKEILKYRYSPDGGQTWQEAETLSDAETEPRDTGNTAISLTTDPQGRLHLVWATENSNGLYYRRWAAGSGWSAPAKITGSEGAYEPDLALDSNNLAHVVWQQSSSGIQYASQKADGLWGTATLIVQDSGPGSSSQPQIAVDAQGGRHFAWSSADEPPDIYYTYLP